MMSFRGSHKGDELSPDEMDSCRSAGEALKRNGEGIVEFAGDNPRPPREIEMEYVHPSDNWDQKSIQELRELEQHYINESNLSDHQIKFNRKKHYDPDDPRGVRNYKDEMAKKAEHIHEILTGHQLKYNLTHGVQGERKTDPDYVKKGEVSLPRI